MLSAAFWWHGGRIGCTLWGGRSGTTTGWTKAKAGECVCTEVVKEQWDEGLVRAAYEELASWVKAGRRLKMWEKIVVKWLGEVSSVTGKILSSTAGN